MRLPWRSLLSWRCARYGASAVRRFSKRFGVSLESVYSKTIEKMKQQGLLEEQDGFLRLTSLGMKYGNVVFEAFLLT